eukprot:g1247.t1
MASTSEKEKKNGRDVMRTTEQETEDENETRLPVFVRCWKEMTEPIEGRRIPKVLLNIGVFQGGTENELPAVDSFLQSNIYMKELIKEFANEGGGKGDQQEQERGRGGKEAKERSAGRARGGVTATAPKSTAAAAAHVKGGGEEEGKEEEDAQQKKQKRTNVFKVKRDHQRRHKEWEMTEKKKFPKRVKGDAVEKRGGGGGGRNVIFEEKTRVWRGKRQSRYIYRKSFQGIRKKIKKSNPKLTEEEIDRMLFNSKDDHFVLLRKIVDKETGKIMYDMMLVNKHFGFDRYDGQHILSDERLAKMDQKMGKVSADLDFKLLNEEASRKEGEGDGYGGYRNLLSVSNNKKAGGAKSYLDAVLKGHTGVNDYCRGGEDAEERSEDEDMQARSDDEEDIGDHSDDNDYDNDIDVDDDDDIYGGVGTDYRSDSGQDSEDSDADARSSDEEGMTDTANNSSSIRALEMRGKKRARSSTSSPSEVDGSAPPPSQRARSNSHFKLSDLKDIYDRFGGEPQSIKKIRKHMKRAIGWNPTKRVQEFKAFLGTYLMRDDKKGAKGETLLKLKPAYE